MGWCLQFVPRLDRIDRSGDSWNGRSVLRPSSASDVCHEIDLITSGPVPARLFFSLADLGISSANRPEILRDAIAGWYRVEQFEPHRAGLARAASSTPAGSGHSPQPETSWCSPQGDVELMPQKEILNFKPAPRLEQIDDKCGQQMEDREHRTGQCADSASPRESRRMELLGTTRIEMHHPLTSGQPPSLSGRNASRAGIVARIFM